MDVVGIEFEDVGMGSCSGEVCLFVGIPLAGGVEGSLLIGDVSSFECSPSSRDFLDSRGSSWQRCPMSRFTHRVQGRSKGTGTSVFDMLYQKKSHLVLSRIPRYTQVYFEFCFFPRNM